MDHALLVDRPFELHDVGVHVPGVDERPGRLLGLVRIANDQQPFVIGALMRPCVGEAQELPLRRRRHHERRFARLLLRLHPRRVKRARTGIRTEEARVEGGQVYGNCASAVAMKVRPLRIAPKLSVRFSHRRVNPFGELKRKVKPMNQLLSVGDIAKHNNRLKT